MGKATPVSFIRESVGQICVVGEWLWSLLKRGASRARERVGSLLLPPRRDMGKALARRAERE